MDSLEKKVSDLTVALMEAKRTNELLTTKYNKLKEENLSVTAQNAIFREHLQFIVANKSYGYNGVKRLLQATPEICLNEVEAEAVLKFSGYLLAKHKQDVVDLAKNYADEKRGL